MFIFDCNGVLVDSEAIVANVAATELTRAGFAVSPEIIARFFAGPRTGLRPDPRPVGAAGLQASE